MISETMGKNKSLIEQLYHRDGDDFEWEIPSYTCLFSEPEAKGEGFEPMMDNYDGLTMLLEKVKSGEISKKALKIIKEIEKRLN